MRTLPLTLLAVAALLAAGCGDARAAPEPGRPGPEASAPEDAGAPPALPDVVGADLDEARAALTAAGAAGVRVLAFDPDGAVTAQQPAAGAPVEDDPVLLWLGEPPAPPPPSDPTRGAAAEATTGTTDGAAAEATTGTTDGAAAEAIDGAAPEATTGTTDEAAAEPGAEAEAPQRTSPRLLPAAPAGLALEGTASWYGPGFAGRPTACGDRFDPDERTLASRELRCGTRVALTGPSGTTVEAVATDWGPAAWTGRRFDLSRATFEALAPLSRGTVAVTLRVLD